MEVSKKYQLMYSQNLVGYLHNNPKQIIFLLVYTPKLIKNHKLCCKLFV